MEEIYGVLRPDLVTEMLSGSDTDTTKTTVEGAKIKVDVKKVPHSLIIKEDSSSKVFDGSEDVEINLNNLNKINLQNGSGEGSLQQKATISDDRLVDFVNPGNLERSQTKATGDNAFAEGESTLAEGPASHSEGQLTYANNQGAHAEGAVTQALGGSSHAEGSRTIAEGNDSHAEGSSTTAFGIASHSGGVGNQDIYYTKEIPVEPNNFKVSSQLKSLIIAGDYVGIANLDLPGVNPVYEGFTDSNSIINSVNPGNYLYIKDENGTILSSRIALVNRDTKALSLAKPLDVSGLVGTCKFYFSQSEILGSVGTAKGTGSFTHGYCLFANEDYQAVFGKFNDNKPDTLFEIGNGSILNRSNAFEVKSNGLTKMKNAIVEGNISASTLNGVSISELGKIEDVRVNNSSIVSNKVANIELKNNLDNATHNEIASALATKNAIDNVREVAEGKSRTFVLSMSWGIINLKNILGVGLGTKCYDFENNDITQRVIDGEFDNVVIGHNDFNTDANNVNIGGEEKYYILNTNVNYAPASKFYLCSNYQIRQLMKLGDILLITETEVPDRWFGGIGPDITFYKLETSKIDVSNLYKKDENIIPTASGLFIGDDEHPFDTIVVSNKISDGVNSVSVEELANKKVLYELTYDGTHILNENGDIVGFADIKQLLDDAETYVYINDLTNKSMLNFGAYEDDALWFNSRYKIDGENYLVRLIINAQDQILHDEDIAVNYNNSYTWTAKQIFNGSFETDRYQFDASAIYPKSAVALLSLGTNTNRFNNLYLKGDAYVNGNISDGTNGVSVAQIGKRLLTIDSQRHLLGKEARQCVGGVQVISDSYVNLGGGVLLKNPYITGILVSNLIIDIVATGINAQSRPVIHKARLQLKSDDELAVSEANITTFYADTRQHTINVNATTNAGTYHCQFQVNAPSTTTFTTTGEVASYLYDKSSTMRISASGTYVASGVKYLITGIATQLNGEQKELVFEMVNLTDGSDLTISSYGLELVDTII